MQNSLPSFFLSSSQFLNSQLNCWVMTLNSIKQYKAEGWCLSCNPCIATELNIFPFYVQIWIWSFPALNKQISYVFHMNLQSCMRKLHFYAVSGLSPGWPRRNRIVAPLYLFIDCSSPQPRNPCPDAAGKKGGSGQAGFLIPEWFQFRAHRAEHQPLSLQRIIVILAGLGCWAGSLIFWARAMALWGWHFIFKGISAQSCLKWSITPEIDCKIVLIVNTEISNTIRKLNVCLVMGSMKQDMAQDAHQMKCTKSLFCYYRLALCFILQMEAQSGIKQITLTWCSWPCAIAGIMLLLFLYLQWITQLSAGKLLEALKLWWLVCVF